MAFFLIIVSLRKTIGFRLFIMHWLIGVISMSKLARTHFKEMDMTGVLISYDDYLVAPNIVPSATDGVIKRSDTSGNRAVFVLPLYKDIAVGDQYRLYVRTNGGWGWGTYGTIASTTKVVTVGLSDPIFVGITTVTAHYEIEKQGREIQSHEAVYSVVD